MHLDLEFGEMMKTFPSSFVTRTLAAVGCALSFFAANSASALTIPNQPLSAQPVATPMIMMALGRDHRLFYEAYNDASDIDGDGTVEIRFKPSITYLGLFNSKYCYTHNNASDGTGLFKPVSIADGAGLTCNFSGNNGGRWSGNWLNYVTTSRIDALRVVLYGGMREVDDTSTTVLRRAYIPQDAHSWAKEYTSASVDGYNIQDYTPLSQPDSNKRHFFGNLTPNASTNCKTLSNCSDLPPWLSVVENSGKRVWEWASTERPVLADSTHGGTRTNRAVRVEVCQSTFTQGCKAYGSKFKPVGILHDFGENESAFFGLVTGSYDSNTRGGRLRKIMSSFKTEVDQTSGVYTSNATIVNTINSLRILDFNNDRTDQIYSGGVIGSRPINNGEASDWGNPIAEIMYEAIRYMGNASAATSDYTSAGTTKDDKIGLPKPSFDQPFSSTSSAKAPWCARTSLLTISDTNLSFDSDDLPGANWAGSISSSLSGKSILSGNASTTFHAANGANTIGSNESGVSGSRFIGQVGATNDNAPTAKTVSNLGNIRGLAPEEPTKQGSYYSAAVAHYAKINDLQPSLQGNQTIDSFVVALASPLLRIEAKMPNGRTISLLPFAKSVEGAFGIKTPKNQYQPTNQIVDFYVQSIINSGPSDTTTTNGGRYEAVFRISFEDVEQGNDHDMDAIVEYTVRATSSTELQVLVRPIYQAGGVKHRMGYIVSGSTQDGVYLVVQDESENNAFFLNVPPGRTPGYCDQSTVPADCARLPYLGGTAGTFDRSTVTFTTSSSPAAQFLKDPLWYAAKWGGFVDSNSNGVPDIQGEWDKDGDGVPDNYFFVQNPTKLKDSLTNAFNAIIERNSSSSNIATNNRDVLTSNTRIYRASYTAGLWTGEVTAFPVTKNGVGVQPAWEASAALPAWGSRRLFMRTSSGGQVNLASTAYSALSFADRTALLDENTLNFIKGDKSKELKQGGTFRNRDTVLGDFIHSSPVVDLDTNLMYIGSNAGKLHAFNLTTGAENFAVIPRASVSKLKDLRLPTYNAAHQYFIDGEISLGFSTPASNNTKYVYTALGRGGKGIFSGHSTGTGNTTWNHEWEYTPAASIAANADKDLGLMTSRPAYAVMNNSMTALITGNGYNSTDGKAVLYIFLINANGSLNAVRKIDTGVAGDNGLAGPAFIDSNGDGKADFIFAGDRLGNLWKFDVSSSNPASWGVALGGLPLFTAKNASNQAQPITAPVYIARNNVSSDPNFNKHFIFFGTGQYIASGDNNVTQTQSIYGIIDSATPITARSFLRQRTITNSGSIASSAVRTFSTKTTGDMSSQSGWYLDLGTPLAGERVIGRSQIVQTVEPALLVPSFYPINNDPCIPGGSGYFNFLDPWSGARIDLDLLDVDKNGKFDSSDRISGAAVSSVNLGIGIPTVPLFIPTQTGETKKKCTGGNCCVGPLCFGDKPDEVIRYCDGNSCDCTGPSCTKPEYDCTGTALIIGSGSDGTAKLDTRCKSGGNLKGRVMWREILKD
jgi:type IV pilus assembly protein PilY1